MNINLVFNLECPLSPFSFFNYFQYIFFSFFQNKASFIINYLLSAYVSIFNVKLDPLIMNLMMFTLLLTTLTLIITGIALAYVTRPIRLRNLLWLPFIHLYWTLQCALTFYALLQILFRRPARWVKTMKTGSCTEESIRMIVD